VKTHRVTVLILLVAGCFGEALSQDLRENLSRSLFSDQKANRVGDAVTVLVVETSSASNDAKTTTSRESDVSLSAAAQTGAASSTDIGMKLGTGNTFRGEGATSRNGSIRAKISAHVDSVLNNGNLLINGTRTTVINGETQIIRISGIVRPSDIQFDNSVYSYNISDATIVFEGDGIVSRVQGPGWLTKLFHWLF